MNQHQQDDLNARLRARATNAKICEQCGRSYASGPMAHQCDRNDLMRRQARAVRNMPPVVTCDNCGLTYYQTAAPHVCAGWTTKENRTMNESEKFITTGVFSHERNTSGNCSVSGCPCRGWSAQESVNEHEHEPVARRGEGERDEWRVFNFTRDGANEWMVTTTTGRTVALANTSDPRLAESEMRQIATEHNQHHSLLTEREKLRTAAQAALDNLYERSLTRKHWSTYDQKVYEQLDAALNDQKEGEG